MLLQDDGADLVRLVAWFREGCSTDKNASLAFSSSLSKAQRAKIHTLVKSVGLGVLQSISEGIGASRQISIVHSGAATSKEDPTDTQRHKAFWIYRWAHGAGIAVSRDEVVQMVQEDSLTPDLQQLWSEGSAQQKLIIRLCESVMQDDLSRLRVCTGIDADSKLHS